MAAYGVLTVAVMVMIFAFSGQDGEESGSLSRWLMETAFGRALLAILPPLTGEGASLDIRKYAHMGEYCLLALFSTLFFVEVFLEKLPKRALGSSLLLSFVYACTDEFHQTFIAGRSGRFSDVCVDLAGVLFGLLLTLPVCRMRKEKR